MAGDAGMTWRAGRSPCRIAVLGCGGSGKTVLANRLGTMLGIPVTHLVQAHSQAWMSGVRRRSP
ncbi:hypothetical protein [Nonomuraea sp. GTA35]|uniref:hypothetical protein n=1 Tax=Nonomuraea sp. GTA35 TaxID=1676746 RepID=UPI0035BF681A